MKPYFIVTLLVLVVVIGILVYTPKATAPQTGDTDVVEETIENSRSYGVQRDVAFGYQFSYPDGPQGYITLEDNESTDPHFTAGIRLMNWQEYEMFAESTDAREGPPAIHVRIYENPENLHAPVWAMRHPNETNYNLKLGEEQEVVVGGANATQFLVDGLYPIDTYVVAHGGRVYVLMGAYREQGDEINKDFADLVDSFTFVEPGMPMGKIDPAVACNYALTTMLFKDGAAADQFLAECIDGLHPEVIEQYIDSLGVDGAVI